MNKHCHWYCSFQILSSKKNPEWHDYIIAMNILEWSLVDVISRSNENIEGRFTNGYENI